MQPQLGANYGDLLRVASACEELGFDGFFMADHVMNARNPGALPGPTDVWTTLAGLARETRSIRLGTLMTSANFRLPGMLAIQVAQVDDMSGGRIELGIGAGWSEEEHRAYGLPFPVRRFDVLEEQLEVITGLWATEPGDRFDYAGEHYALVSSPALPKPHQSPPPIIIGGTGATRTPALAARFAAEYNASYAVGDQINERFDSARRACEHGGRDPDDLVYSVMSPMSVGESSTDVERRAGGRTLEEALTVGVAGSPEQATAKLLELQDKGVDRIYLQFPGFADLDHLALVARDVLPQLRASQAHLRVSAAASPDGEVSS